MPNTILGLTCISEELKDKNKKKYSFRTMTRKRFHDLERSDAIHQLSERILHNARATRYIINHCILHNIFHYRLSSALFPLITDAQTDVTLDDLNPICLIQIKEELEFAGKIAKKYNISIGSHPDQFNVLASTNEDAVNRTINELNFQASVLDMVGLPQDHTAPMNIHINYTPKADEGVGIVAERFYKNLMRCNEGVFNRLTIENEDKGFFNVDNCIKFSEYLWNTFGLNIPVCYDNLHDFCNPSEERNVILQAERCAYTWVNQSTDDVLSADTIFLSPVVQWSEGTPEKPRSHAEYFALGNYPPHIAIDPDNPVKWECEVKGKDKAIRLLRKNLIGA